MKKKYYKWGFIVGLLALGVIFFGGFGNTSKGQYSIQSIPAPSLQGNLLEDSVTQQIAVYLPESYGKSEKHYPVVYFLPGFCDSYAYYGTELQKAMDFMLGQQKVKEMIVVTIKGMNKLHGSYYVNSPVIGNWEDFVVKDVVRYVDQNYRTIPQSESRGIAGHSMGGFGALNLAMRHPDVFSCVYSMSPGLFDDNGLDKVDFDMTKTSLYTALAPEKAREEYLQMIKGVQYPDDFSYAYGSAFSPDPQGKAPYVKFVDPSLSVEARRKDPTWQAWNNGYGNWGEKVKKYKENLLKLKAIAIDYGKQDGYGWIPEGCAHFSGLLKKENIAHDLFPYEGDHINRVNARLGENVIPYFSSKLAFE